MDSSFAYVFSTINTVTIIAESTDMLWYAKFQSAEFHINLHMSVMWDHQLYEHQQMVQAIYRDRQCGKDTPWVANTIKLRCGSCSAGFHMEHQGVHLLSKGRFKDALLNNCMQNSSTKPTSRTKQLKAVQKTYGKQ